MATPPRFATQVAVLVILECEGKEYTVLVRQARVPVGYHSLPEIPAGKCTTQPAASRAPPAAQYSTAAVTHASSCLVGLL
eukprot:COSAG04_NODE_2387_length_4228_cov_1.352386_2_plen_80_part_00